MSVDVVTSPGALDIHVRGVDRLWGLRSRLEIPLGRVVSAEVMPVEVVKADLRLRTGGLGLPGLAAVGHFRGAEATKQWWRVYRATDVVVIELAADSQFDRIVLEIDDPGGVVGRINEARSKQNPDPSPPAT